eukprot:364893-Chlamydomonas_euryale.AAC.7
MLQRPWWMCGCSVAWNGRVVGRSPERFCLPRTRMARSLTATLAVGGCSALVVFKVAARFVAAAACCLC